MKNFLLGVGAQKSGTSWVYDYLSKHPDVNLGFKKEYHIFDSLYVPECRPFLNQKLKRLRKFNGNKIISDENTVKEFSFLSDESKYFDYFSDIANMDNVLLTGDITPSYSALPKKVFRYIKEEFYKRGVSVKILFMMREPVDRCLSATRMFLRSKKGENWTKKDEYVYLNKFFNSRETEIRTRYDITIKNIERVFPKEDIIYLFYEDFFYNKKIELLTSALELPFRSPEFENYVNVSRTDHEISNRLKYKIYIHYKDVYKFIERKFGYDYIKYIWGDYDKNYKKLFII